jgi:probable HAF family extracellular repeat protein
LVHGYVQVGNRYTTVDDPAAAQGDFVNGINDLGQLVGGYFDATGLEHAFLASPGQDDAASASAPAAPALPTAFATDSAPPVSSWLSTRQPTVPTSPVSGLAPPPALRPSPTVVVPTARATASLRVRAADAVFAAAPAATPEEATGLFAPLDASGLDAV